MITATPAVALAFDLAAPATKLVTRGDFPCVFHECGCKTAEQCALRCCCRPQRVQPKRSCQLSHDEQPVRVRISVLTAEACRGHHRDGRLAAHAIDPHLPLESPARIPASRDAASALHEPPLQQLAWLDPPDQVPRRLIR